ncbi:LytR C-terminal domain-containing protein [Actinotalea fermentans]|uniref:LytR C-terminal domain-containing protein n=1 Tax=Actinotalea fermentans TaxID=43671 RepID=UPI00051F3AE3|nr:LytR C-terminal domain-containing protein [Actinotalea fermentans]KGM16497.1 hypothetical protein N867_19510 [Actinotalea fermentans ATCC 43279 = JCM 9966 = DSM 3133]
MKPGSYPYPPDEFDAAARAGGPRGVHRAPRSRWSRWWPFLVVLVVFPALAYAAVTVLSDWDGLSSSDSGTEAQPPADDEPADDPTQAEETPAATPTETATPEPPPPPPLDQARPVDVFNATNRSGLAGNASDRLEAAGFTDVSALNWDGDDPAASVVYYATANDITTAQLVAQTLGIAQVVESATDAPEGIVVVLATDYQAT